MRLFLGGVINGIQGNLQPLLTSDAVDDDTKAELKSIENNEKK